MTVANLGVTAETRATHAYAIAGVSGAITARAGALAQIDETYGAFRTDGCEGDAFELDLAVENSAFVLNSPDGLSRRFENEGDALLAIFGQLSECVIARLAIRGVFAIHAAAVVGDAGAVVIAGRSGSGKTTLALDLLRHGFRLLSDEHAISDTDARTILPYRRAVHIRARTATIVPELAFLEQRPMRRLPGGDEWALLPAELEEVFPGCLADAAPLRHVVLLGARTGEDEAVLETIPGALAAVELVASTPAAVDHFDAVLQRTAKLVEGARCTRLLPGSPASTRETLLRWLDA